MIQSNVQMPMFKLIVTPVPFHPDLVEPKPIVTVLYSVRSMYVQVHFCCCCC